MKDIYGIEVKIGDYIKFKDHNDDLVRGEVIDTYKDHLNCIEIRDLCTTTWTLYSEDVDFEIYERSLF